MLSRAYRLLLLTGLMVMLSASAVLADSSRLDEGQIPTLPEGTCPTDPCPPMPPSTIAGTLGSCGNWPDCVSGVQTGRLNRNGVASTCAAPKICDIFLTNPGRAYDAYTIPNNTGGTACVTVVMTVITQTACNLQVNAYLDTYDPVNICPPQSNYLADPGLSSGTPPNPVGPFCFNVPDGGDLILVVHTTNPGEIGCQYELNLTGDCIPVGLQEFSVE